MKAAVVFFISIIVFIIGSQIAQAYEYPIYELGNCRDTKECHLYCEIPENHAACWSYSVYGARDVLGDETPETKVADLGITFPIAELGNCTSIASCKTFCVSSQNQEACQIFAESHGLTKKERVVEKAQTELGCTTLESCKSFCENAANQETCSSFAKRYNLKTVAKNRMLELAKTELGCTSLQECRALCAQTENHAKCVGLAQKMGQGDTRKEELLQKAKLELGCTSFEDCRTFCQNKENADKCRSFGQAIKMGVKNRIMEKGDCESNEECRKVCETDPQKCPTFPKRRLQNSGSSSRPKTESELETDIESVDKELNSLDAEDNTNFQTDLNSL